ncbi:unnamed protein product [Closterium sp. Naga37s-1]|nr:unnamed protein product [Closterium sp. Naga37s-1]
MFLTRSEVSGGVLTWTRMLKMFGKSNKAKQADAERGEPSLVAYSSASPPAPLLCQQVAMADVLRATGGWEAERRIGNDGFGYTYRGINEMASKYHPHLVRLLGFCVDYDAEAKRMEQIAIYEFMPNGDLHHRLHGDDGTGCTSVPLTLQQRLDILIGVARGLEYLHSFGIVHRDIKPLSIFLDGSMQAKIAGFDHVKGAGDGGDVFGVPGYLDPHVWQTKGYAPTTVNDLYSLGVVLLELLSGRRAVTPGKTERQYLRDSVESQLEANDLAALFDPSLTSSFLPPATNTSISIPSSTTTSSFSTLSGAASTTKAGTAAASAADTTLGVPIPNVLIPSLVRLARVGLACTAMPASTRPSVGKLLAELKIVRDDVATALRQKEEEVDKQEGELQGGRVAVAVIRGNELLDSLGNPSHADPSSTSPNPSTLPSQLPPPPPAVLASSSSALPPAPLLCQQVAMADVLRATAGWAAERRIGSGGYGVVYRGVSPLDGCTLWAVKRAQVLTNDFRREIDEMASKHHPHLVRLLGYCVDYDAAAERMEQIAIYEFMPNGDLHHRLHGDENKAADFTPLTLQQRLDILIGVARALEYLHSFGIVHRDVKPANILLDAHMQAKLADFGLLRLAGGSCSLQSTRVRGTPGYVDPVYSITHKATPTADVYSFGVVMMELLTCKRVVMPCEDGLHINIKDWVEQQVERGDSASVVNEDLNAPHAMASKLVDISLSCVAKLVSNRPSTSQVLVELEALRRELMGGKQERVARQLDAQVQRASLDCRQLEEELAMIYGAQNK